MPRSLSKVWKKLRQIKCKHEWKGVPDFYGIGAAKILNYGGIIVCKKCGKEKVLRYGEVE